MTRMKTLEEFQFHVISEFNYVALKRTSFLLATIARSVNRIQAQQKKVLMSRNDISKAKLEEIAVSRIRMSFFGLYGISRQALHFV